MKKTKYRVETEIQEEYASIIKIEYWETPEEAEKDYENKDNDYLYKEIKEYIKYKGKWIYRPWVKIDRNRISKINAWCTLYINEDNINEDNIIGRQNLNGTEWLDMYEDEWMKKLNEN